jgi:uncharacterized protein with NAD-binding domain and iron-sulfur cluster
MQLRGISGVVIVGDATEINSLQERRVHPLQQQHYSPLPPPSPNEHTSEATKVRVPSSIDHGCMGDGHDDAQQKTPTGPYISAVIGSAMQCCPLVWQLPSTSAGVLRGPRLADVSF